MSRGGALGAQRRLAGGGELTRKELETLVGRERTAGVGLWVDLVRAPPSGTWERRRADRFALAEDWIGPAPRPERRGGRRPPSSRATWRRSARPRASNVAGFTGLALRPLDRPAREAWSSSASAARKGEDLLNVPGGLLPDGDAPAPPRFLPTWDATLLVHARRTGRAPRGLPAAPVRHQDAGVVPVVPRRRRGRGDLALRGRRRAARALRAAPEGPMRPRSRRRPRGSPRSTPEPREPRRATSARTAGATSVANSSIERRTSACGSVADAHLHQEPVVAEDLVLEAGSCRPPAADCRHERAAGLRRHRTARG